MYLFMTTWEKDWKVVFLNPIEDQEIIRTVQHLKNKMSTDCSDVNMNMIKKILKL